MPRDYFFTQNDSLVLTAFNSLASVVLDVQGFIENDNGELVPFSFQLTPTSDRLATVGSHLIGQGWLHNLVIRPSAGSPVRGQTYCRLTKRYGSQAAGLDLAVIAQGYVSDGEWLQYPWGKYEGPTDGQGWMHVVTGADPAAGAEASDAVPTGALWNVHAYLITLVTDATVANRTPYVTISDGSTVHSKFAPATTQAATLTFDYSMTQSAQVTVSVGTGRFSQFALENRLPAGSVLATESVNLQAGDNYSAPVMYVEEWLQP